MEGGSREDEVCATARCLAAVTKKGKSHHGSDTSYDQQSTENKSNLEQDLLEAIQVRSGTRHKHHLRTYFENSAGRQPMP
jgi:hypothetical protein